MATISLDNGYISNNDDIVIMGENSDTYIHQNAKLIKYLGKNVDKTPRGTKERKVEIELKFKESAIGNGLDKVYIFTDKTYWKRKYSL